MAQPRIRASHIAVFLTTIVLAGAATCSPVDWTNAFVNNTTALGSGTTPLGGPTDTLNRDSITVAVHNNTPYFVSAFFGAFDPLNELLAPTYGQFRSSSDTPDQILGPFETSERVTFICHRTVSLGDTTLIEAIRDRDPFAPVDELAEGMTFSTRLLDDPDTETFTVNNIPNQRVEIGVDYECDALVFYELSLDEAEPSGIRIDVSVVLP